MRYRVMVKALSGWTQVGPLCALHSVASVAVAELQAAGLEAVVHVLTRSQAREMGLL